MNSITGFVAFRAGSKRLPKKNGRKLGDKPLYRITLDKLVDLKKAGVLNAVVASTDSPEWQQHCNELYGDDVTIHRRPVAVSGDRSSDTEVVLDFFNQHPELKGSAILLSLCTYPFMKSSVLEEMARVHKETQRSVFAVTASHHMPQKLLRVEDGVIRPYLFDRMDEFESNTKLLIEQYPEAYHSTGAFLISDAFQTMTQLKDLWHQEDIGYVMDTSFHVDIDNLEDFELARLRFAQTKAYE